MSAIPATFRAYVAEKVGDGVERGVREFRESDLPPGEVEIRIAWSSVNYKDGLATRADGKVARISPLIPGIDLAGEVIASDDRSIAVGIGRPRPRLRAGRLAPRRVRGVRARAGRLGRAPGARADAARRDGHRDGRLHGGDVRGRARGARARPADGPVLVTGASGGVGGTAAGDPGRPRLRGLGGDRQARRGGAAADLGAAGILTRDEVTAEGRPLESERWAGAVDAVGGATLPYVLRTLRTGGAVAACGNAGGAKLETTVFPFILRGVALLGMDSVNMPIARRRDLWDRLATDLRPRDLGLHCHGGHPRHARGGARRDRRRRGARGRWIVRIGE